MHTTLRRVIPRLILLLGMLPLTLSVTTAQSNDLPIDSKGWSILSRSSDSRVIYCSHSQGSDSNNGLSESAPVKTLNKAFSLVRKGYPDHVYLKRGDVWTDQTFNALGNRSGRSGNERIVVSYYGSGARPLIKTNNVQVMNNKNLYHVAIVGIEFYNYTANPRDNNFVNVGAEGKIRGALQFVGVRVSNLLVEDCKFSFYRYHVDLFNKNLGIGNAFINIDLRRNIFLNAYQRGSTYGEKKSQGIFISHTAHLLIEENFFDHNGWYDGFADTKPNKYNHNIYLSKDNKGPIVVRGNVLSRASAHGLQLRSGGTAEYNAFIGNSVGMNIGYDTFPKYYTGSTSVKNNVVTDGRPQIQNDNTPPQSGAIWGIWKRQIKKLTVSNNIVANIQNTNGGNMVPYKEMTANEFGSGNIAYRWVEDNVPSSNPGWVDPNRDKDSYAKSVGYTSYNMWVQAASKRSLRSWPSKFTARRYVDYIKAGFRTGGGLRLATTPSALSQSNANGGFTYQIYPNPATSRSVTIESSLALRTIRVLSIDGRSVRQVQQPTYRHTLDLGDLTAGVYIVELTAAHQQIREKLVVR